MNRQGETIRTIRSLVRNGKLLQPFTPQQVNHAAGITFAGTFLPKHRLGNPGGNTVLFLQVAVGSYRLTSKQEALVATNL